MQPACTCAAMKTWSNITKWQVKGLQLCQYYFFTNILKGEVHPVTGREVPEDK